MNYLGVRLAVSGEWVGSIPSIRIILKKIKKYYFILDK